MTFARMEGDKPDESRPDESVINDNSNNKTDTIVAEINQSQPVQSKHIKPIDKNVVHRICSGQVVVTLSTAVKELVENSIDAGATSVDIKLVEYGSKCIEVSDNGSGVDEENFEGLGLKHHTSKIQQFEDLSFVETFGFRGEALSSLCALSNLTVITKSRKGNEGSSASQSQGTRIEYDHKGRIKHKQLCAREFGTTVILKNLFSTLPVRHSEFMKNLKREFVKMIQVLYGYCLITVGVRINCTNVLESGTVSKVVSISASNSIKEKIVCLFGSKEVNSLIEIKEASLCENEAILSEFGISEKAITNPYKFSGYISLPYKGRSASDRQFLFINSRPCESVKITRIINDVYHNFSKNSRFPFVFLHINTEQQNVDVNVTPDKRQIYLRSEKFLYASIKATLIAVMEDATSSFSSDGLCQDTLRLSQASNGSRSDVEQPCDGTSISNPVDTDTDDVTEETEGEISQNSQSFNDKFSRNTSSKYPNKTNPIHSKKLQNNSDIASSVSGANFFQKFAFRTKSKLGSDNSATASTSGFMSNSTKMTKNSKSSKVTSFFPKSTRNTNTPDSSLDEDDDSEDECEGESVSKRSRLMVIDDSKYERSSTTMSACNSDHNNVMCIDIEPTSSNVDADVDCASKEEVEREEIVMYDDDDEFKDDCNLGKTVVITSENLEPCSFKLYGNAKVVKVDWKNVEERLKIAASRKTEAQENSDRSRKFRAKISAAENKNAEEELKKQITKDMFKEMQILGQFNNGFIIVKHGTDLFIVDQHASDEKYNFETLESSLILQSQQLICPLDLQLPVASELVLMDRIDVFRKNGFDFIINEEGDPSSRVQLSKIPYSRTYEFGKEDVEELIFLLEDAPENAFYRPKRVRDMLASRACKKAVKIGNVLEEKRMRTIVDHMGMIEQPWNCPHGRPTIRHLINLNLLPDFEMNSVSHVNV